MTSEAKKKNIQSKFKNILVQPIPYYWPEINKNDAEHLKLLFNEEKQTFKQINIKEIGIKLGLNDSLRLLKKEKSIYFCISTEIKPKFIVNQIINMIIKNYPDTKLICIPNLKSFTEEIFGIPSLALSISKQTKLNKITEFIYEKCEEHPISKEITQYYGNEKNKKTNDESERKTIQKIMLKEEEEINFNDLYLPKSTDNKFKKSFVPANVENIESSNFEVQNQSNNLNYISFSNSKKIIKKNETNLNLSDNDESDEEFKKYEEKLVNILQTFVKSDSNEKDEAKNIEFLNSNDNSKRYKRKHNSNKTNFKKQKLTESKCKYISLKVNKIQGNINRNI